jgi:hypothetical protein
MRGDNLSKLAEVLVKKASEGNLAALKEIGDRIEGKVPLREASEPEKK